MLAPSQTLSYPVSLTPQLLYEPQAQLRNKNHFGTSPCT
uniref:Uncharacterized protein n=1 Tax=Anguilla anguilla TaxID=7936 RepID=A0A0E9PZB9_ANGAN